MKFKRLLTAAVIAAVPFAAGAETWRFSAAQVSSSQREGRSSTVLDGGVRVESETMLITANHLELSGADYENIGGHGEVSLTDRERNIIVTSSRFDYDRNAEIIRFREQVTLVDEEEGIVIRCESLDLLEAQEIVLMQSSVRLIKDQTVSRGEFAIFRMDDNLLEITGRPVVWKEGDEYEADRITVNLDTEEITLEGTVAGALSTKDEND